MALATVARRLDRRVAFVVLCLATAGTGISSLALVTDTLIVTNTHTTLTIDLQANGQQSVNASFNWTAPGQEAAQALTISNAGNAQLRYALRSTGTGTGSFANDSVNAFLLRLDDPGIQCTIALGTAQQGTTLLSNPNTNDFLNIQFGDPTTGQQPGDRVLDANASERLCLRMTHDATSPSGSAEHRMTFSAESTTP